jgi:small subunit ribosomal protein S20
LANHKSAEKRARQTLKKNARNAATIKSVRTFEKKLRAAVEKKDKAESEKLLSWYISKAGKAAAKGSLKKQNVARKVSRLSSLVSATFAK